MTQGSIKELNLEELPLVRLRLVVPLLEALESCGISGHEVIERVGLTRDAIYDPETFLHASIVYQFMEEVAAEADDIQFAAKVAEGIDVTRWISLEDVGGRLATVGNLLTAIAVAATEHSSSTQHSLEINGRNALLGGRRSFDTVFTSAQIDAFFAALMVSLIRRAMGSLWEPQKVRVTVSEPKALPPIFYGVALNKGKGQGYRLRFPSIWLNEPFVPAEFQQQDYSDRQKHVVGQAMLAAFFQTLEPHIGEPALDNKRAAELCGMSHRSLSRKLASEGMSIGSALDTLKCDAARSMLLNTELKIAEIATSLGYTDPTSFTRSFKRWTGMSPFEYRRS